MRAVVAAVLLAATPAAAGGLALNAGAIEVVGLPPQHLGLYPYVGLSWVEPLGKVTLIPGLAFEVAPENGRLGLVGSLVVDYSLSSSWGVDLNAAVIHDQPGFDFRQAAFYAGLGLGVSYSFEAGVPFGEQDHLWTISPSLNAFIALDGTGAPSLVPALNLAVSL